MNELIDRPEILDVPEADDQQPLRPPPVARPLSALVRCETNDPNELLRFRYLCRGGGLLLPGPSGIGKSTLALQMAILWALFRTAFGIEPARPLKSLFIQAEDDDGDLAEMRDGIFAGLDLTPEERAQAAANVIVACEDERTGLSFLSETVRPLVGDYKPDMLWINPALAYLGGDASSQKDVGFFLRNGLNPILREFGCGSGVVHHTNKPANGRDRPNWNGGDFAYMGTGSAEWANWPRGVLGLRSFGSHDVFELRAGKRGQRLGWCERDGKTKAFVKYLAHSKEPGRICWHEIDPADIETGGRPKSYDADELLGLLPAEGLTTSEWVKRAKSECGVSETTLHRERRLLEKARRVLKSKTSNKWQPVQKT
jgi:hypothetical protein